MHARWYSYFEGSMHLHLLPILGMGGRGPLEKRASPFLGKGRHLRTVPWPSPKGCSIVCIGYIFQRSIK